MTRKNIFLALITAVILFLTSSSAHAVQMPGKNSAGNDISITEPIDDTIFMAGNNLEVANQVSGDVFATGQSFKFQGTIGGNLFVAANTVEINGHVEGNIFLLAASARFGSQTTVNKDVLVWAQDILKDQNAQIKGQFLTPTKSVKTFGERLSNHILATLSLLFLGFLITLLAPKSFKKMVDISLEAWGPAILWGVIGLIAAPIMATILMVTRIGLPVGLMLFALYIVELYVTTLIIGCTLGRLLTRHRVQLVWSMAIGVIIIQILRFIPGVNGLITMIVMIWGLGSIILGKKALLHHFRHDL